MHLSDQEIIEILDLPTMVTALRSGNLTLSDERRNIILPILEEIVADYLLLTVHRKMLRELCRPGGFLSLTELDDATNERCLKEGLQVLSNDALALFAVNPLMMLQLHETMVFDDSGAENHETWHEAWWDAFGRIGARRMNQAGLKIPSMEELRTMVQKKS